MKNNKDTKFQISRKLFEHELWLYKPSSWIKIWIYILGNVNHTDNEYFKRGEGFFNLSREISLLGEDVTYNKIKSFLQYARKKEIITTRKTTRGIVIKVLKYNENQGFKSSSTTTRTTTEPQQNHNRTTTISKNEKNVKNEKNIIVSKKYSDKDIKLTKLLFNLMSENYSFIKEKEIKISEYETMNKIHRLDKYDYQDIELIIRFSQQDDFWKQNIRSVSKLRKQFETLLIKVQTANKFNKTVVV